MRLLLCALTALTVHSGAMRAHHSVLAFDGSRPTSVEGVVREVLWSYPHTYIVVAAGAGGARWVIEAESSSVLRRLGWTAESVRVGERVRSVGGRAKDGSRVVRCREVAVEGREPLACYPLSSLNDSRPHYGFRK